MKWTHRRFLPTVSDVAVVMVGPMHEAPRAVIKLATTPLAAESLRRERDVLIPFVRMHGSRTGATSCPQ